MSDLLYEVEDKIATITLNRPDRAIAIEEGIAALVFSYAAGSSFFDGVSTIDYTLLRTTKDLTAHHEVKRASMKEWEKAILGGFGVWRTLKHRGGIIHGNLRTKGNLV
ncbi:MAG TPA: hypothetical protein VJX71_01165 [Methylomirabilota bacterium]|nr:hypothetical protein [Methylomirabilota bacterium]